jgi:hypothetical protein
MPTISSASAVYGLTAVGTHSRTNVTGTATIGIPTTQQRFPTGTAAYSIQALFVGTGDDLVIDLLTGDTTGSTAWVAGNAQVETATIVAAAGATSNGTMTLVLTTSTLGSPLNIDVPLTTAAHTTAALIAAAARTAINSNATLAAFNPPLLTAGGTGADIVLTILPYKTFTVGDTSVPLYQANDATLNLAIPSGLGVTAAATSANTTEGVATDGVKIFDYGVDFEGRPVATMSGLLATCFVRNYGAIDYSASIGSTFETIGTMDLKIDPQFSSSTLTFTPSTNTPADLEIVVVGTTA